MKLNFINSLIIALITTFINFSPVFCIDNYDKIQKETDIAINSFYTLENIKFSNINIIKWNESRRGGCTSFPSVEKENQIRNRKTIIGSLSLSSQEINITIILANFKDAKDAILAYYDITSDISSPSPINKLFFNKNVTDLNISGYKKLNYELGEAGITFIKKNYVCELIFVKKYKGTQMPFTENNLKFIDNVIVKICRILNK
jgi:hypothetical protein